MKAESTISNRGVSLIELIIAIAILSLGISASIMLAFANQTLRVDAGTNSEAIFKAESLLENERADSRLDFGLVNPIPPTADGIYTKQILVETLPDFFTKKITSIVSWLGENNRNLSIQLTTLVTDPEGPGGGNTCNSVLSGDWTNPQIQTWEFGRDILNDTSSGFPISSVQTYNHKMYVTVNNTNGNNSGTFYILDITNPALKPILLSPPLFDNNSSVGQGLNAVAYDGSRYAYVANAYGANYTTCSNSDGTNYSCGQLQIIDTQVPSAPIMKYSYKIPDVRGTGGQGIGKSIFYKDGVVYLGLAKATGPEFNIIDVGGLGTPGASPTNPVKVGSHEIDGAVNSIYVKNEYAYIASPDDNQELKIFNISTPSAPILVGSYDAPGGGGNYGNGKSLALIGNSLYLGRTLLSGDELYILNNVNPATIPLPSLGSKNIQDSGANTSVNGIIVRDFLSFLITNEEFQILKIDNPNSITQYAPPIILPPGSGNVDGSAADCEGNYIFVGSQGSNDKGYISTITAN